MIILYAYHVNIHFDAASAAQITQETLVLYDFKAEKWMNQYINVEVEFSSTSEIWKESPMSIHCIPTVYKNKKGRPKNKARIKSAFELSKKKK